MHLLKPYSCRFHDLGDGAEAVAGVEFWTRVPQKINQLKKGVFIHYVLLFTALGLLPILLRLAAFASNLTWILALYFSFRFFRRPRPDAGVAKLRAA
jgi:hypothetical protein